MSVAMMVPAALPAARHVGANSLRRRRRRAVGEFVAAYVGVWVLFGLIALPAVSLASGGLPADVVLAGALVAAAAWQLSPHQRRFVRACHRTVPLPPRGWRAEAASARFGLRHGRACIGVCWPLMLVMAVVMHETVLWMVALTAIASARRLVPGSGRMTAPLAALLVAGAVGLIVLGPVRSVPAEPGPAHGEHPPGSLSRAGAVVAGEPMARPWLCRPARADRRR